MTSPDPAGSWPAPAKLNLFLRVTGRRPDGYHTLQTLFQLLDWGDEVRIRERRSPVIERTGGDYGVSAEDDLVVRAARLLQAAAGSGRGAEVSVVKRVPLGSGLGGGSSDAATVLLVLNRLWNCRLNLDELAELGARLGADIPVFVRGHSALAEGIGERLRPVELGRRHYVLVFPDIRISTAEIFADPDLPRDSLPLDPQRAMAGDGGNDCEHVVRKRYPRIAAMLDDLQRWGRPRLTGTGSAIFIPQPDREQAESTARSLKTIYNVRAASGVDRSSLHEQLDAGG